MSHRFPFKQTATFAFAIYGRIPTNGKRIFAMHGDIGLASNPLPAPFDGHVHRITLRSNDSDSSNDYEARVSANGTGTVIETAAFPSGSTEKVYKDLSGTPFVEGDDLRVKCHRTEGSGESDFTRLTGTMTLVED
jgi:hypothetical protein